MSLQLVTTSDTTGLSQSAGFLFPRCCKVISVTQTNICNFHIPAFSQRHSDGAGKHYVVQLVNLVKHLTSSLFIIAAVPCWSNPTGLLQFHSVLSLHLKYRSEPIIYRQASKCLVTHDKDRCHLTFTSSLM